MVAIVAQKSVFNCMVVRCLVNAQKVDQGEIGDLLHVRWHKNYLKCFFQGRAIYPSRQSACQLDAWYRCELTNFRRPKSRCIRGDSTREIPSTLMER
jgi:hypothetical protein